MTSATDAIHRPTGLDVMRGIQAGVLPPPPLAKLIGLRCIGVEPGVITMRLDHRDDLENSARMLHGGALATMLDTAMGAAAFTLLPATDTLVTVDLSITYLHPARAANAPFTATAHLFKAGRSFHYVTAEIVDASAQPIAHATGKFAVRGA